jgi:four helix bundle protein
MSIDFNFEKLNVYQKALSFVNEVYEITRTWPRDYAFSLTDQLRRAALSIILNIAEEASRTQTEFKRFITISRSSCHECIPIWEIAYKQGIIDLKRKEVWREEIISVSKMLSKLKGSIS